MKDETMSEISIPADTINIGDVVRLDSSRQNCRITMGDVQIWPIVEVRDTLPPVSIFEKIPSLAVEWEAGGRRIVEFWHVGVTIACSDRSGGDILPARWPAGAPMRCYPCERGDLLTRVPWPEDE